MLSEYLAAVKRNNDTMRRVQHRFAMGLTLWGLTGLCILAPPATAQQGKGESTRMQTDWLVQPTTVHAEVKTITGGVATS